MAYGDQVLASATAGQASLLWGAAGQGLFLCSLWQASLRQEYLDGAVRLAEAIRGGTLPAMFGGAWPPDINSPLPAVPVGLASGFAGIGTLFLPLYRATRDERWADTLRTMAELLRRTAVPEHGGVSWPLRLDGGAH
jgi:hypothetical protein